MQFLYPGFFIALLALAIPIIIHLFYFRRYKKVYFSNVAFLREVKEESQSRRRLRNLLVLLMRLFALALLVSAFALPFMPSDEPEALQAPQAISLFIDNSFSMEALSEEVPLLDKAKQRAREIINAYGADDKFQILTHDVEGRHQHLVSQEEALAFIDEVQASPAVRTLEEVLDRQRQILQTASGSLFTAYHISDFQQNISNIENYQDSSLQLRLVPLQAVEQRNVAIDSVWFDAPVQMLNQNNTLLVKLTNYSNEDVEDQRLTLRYDGQEKPVGNFRIRAGETIIDSAVVTILKTGWQQAELLISDFPITFDNAFRFAFKVPDQVKVLVINDGGSQPYVSAALSGANAFEVSQRSRLELDYADFKNQQLIVLNDLPEVSSGLASELRQFVEGGGNVLVFPAATANVDSYNAFMRFVASPMLAAFEKGQQRVATVNTREFIFKDVFENVSNNLRLPTTDGRFAIVGRRGMESLLSYRDGKPMLAKYKLGRGHLFVSAAPLDPKRSDLVRQAEVFVPMVYKMAISTGEQPRISYTIGQDENIRTDAAAVGPEASLRLRSADQEFIPLVRNLGKSVILGLQGSIQDAGFYSLVNINDETPQAVFAFNYDRRESDFRFYNADELTERLGSQVLLIDGNAARDLTPIIGSQNEGTQWWRWCLWGVLGFLLLEVLLLRFWKT